MRPETQKGLYIALECALPAVAAAATSLYTGNRLLRSLQTPVSGKNWRVELVQSQMQFMAQEVLQERCQEILKKLRAQSPRLSTQDMQRVQSVVLEATKPPFELVNDKTIELDQHIMTQRINYTVTAALTRTKQQIMALFPSSGGQSQSEEIKTLKERIQEIFKLQIHDPDNLSEKSFDPEDSLLDSHQE
jgi:apolipoprotein N-acyltransferase